MVEDKWEAWLSLLDEEARSYQDLVSMGDRKRDLLATGAIGPLDEILTAEQVLLGRLKTLTARRSEIEAGLVDDEHPVPVTLHEWAELADEQRRPVLRGIHATLVVLADRLVEQERVNGALIRQWLEFVNRGIELLRADESVGLYEPHGRQVTAVRQRSLDRRL